jgi:hypothetical protein
VWHPTTVVSSAGVWTLLRNTSRCTDDHRERSATHSQDNAQKRGVSHWIFSIWKQSYDRDVATTIIDS